MPSRVAAIHSLDGMRTRRCTSVMTWPVLRSYQRRLSSSVDAAELDDEVAGEVLGLDLAALLPPEPEQGGFVVPHDDPGVRAADEGAAVPSFQWLQHSQLPRSMLSLPVLSAHVTIAQ